MPQETIRQVNFTRGEIDPDMDQRSELKDYFRGLALCTNMIITPQGPVKRRGGTAFLSQIRNPMVQVSMEPVTLTAPSGGTAENARINDGTYFVTTAALDSTEVLVLLEVDFTGPTAIDAVDLTSFSAVAPGGSTGSPPAPPGGWIGGGDGSLPA